MNQYLDRLRGSAPEKQPEGQPTKPTKPVGYGSLVGSGGFVGDSHRRFSGGQEVHAEGGQPTPDSPTNETGSTAGSAFVRVLAVLERGCPAYVEDVRWWQACEDGRRFLAEWGDKATELGWSSRDLFGLHTVPSSPHPSYARLSRYDETGLIWLLDSKVVTALTEITADIRHRTGAITVYRKLNKPALGPLGDSLEDFV